MRFHFLLGLVGIGLGAYGVQEYRLTRVAKAEPQTLSCKDLAAQGPGDNAHVTLTEFLAVPGTFVYETRRNKWTAAWIPIVPFDSDYAREVADHYHKDPDAKPPLPRDIRVVAKLPEARSAEDVFRTTDAETLTGLVINEVSSLDSDTQKLLTESYPGVDFGRCWIFEEGRKPASTLKSFGLLGGGLAALGLAVGLFLRQRRAKAAAPPPPAPPSPAPPSPAPLT